VFGDFIPAEEASLKLKLKIKNDMINLYITYICKIEEAKLLIYLLLSLYCTKLNYHFHYYYAFNT